MKPEPIDFDLKVATHKIVFDAIVETYAALNATTVLYEASPHDESLEAIDQIMQAMQHLAAAGRHIYRLPEIT